VTGVVVISTVVAAVPTKITALYDRYGHVGYEASVPKDFFKAREKPTQDRVEFTVNF
jgi:hypothetical protein